MSDPFSVTICHNPMCGAPRKALAAVEAKSYAPTIVAYPKTRWTSAQLKSLFAATPETPRRSL
jgi:arsenate reductase-like glutaredoxin family protein